MRRQSARDAHRAPSGSSQPGFRLDRGWAASSHSTRAGSLREGWAYAAPYPSLARLLPAAEAYDTHREALERQFRIRELRVERDLADKASRRARARLPQIPARTVEGLAVHTRALASTAWYEGNTPYTALLLSAAAITGVTLRQSDFDVFAWIAAWELPAYSETSRRLGIVPLFA